MTNDTDWISTRHMEDLRTRIATLRKSLTDPKTQKIKNKYLFNLLLIENHLSQLNEIIKLTNASGFVKKDEDGNPEFNSNGNIVYVDEISKNKIKKTLEEINARCKNIFAVSHNKFTTKAENAEGQALLGLSVLVSNIQALSKRKKSDYEQYYFHELTHTATTPISMAESKINGWFDEANITNIEATLNNVETILANNADIQKLEKIKNNELSHSTKKLADEKPEFPETAFNENPALYQINNIRTVLHFLKNINQKVSEYGAFETKVDKQGRHELVLSGIRLDRPLIDSAHGAIKSAIKQLLQLIPKDKNRFTDIMQATMQLQAINEMTDVIGEFESKSVAAKREYYKAEYLSSLPGAIPKTAKQILENINQSFNKTRIKPELSVLNIDIENSQFSESSRSASSESNSDTESTLSNTEKPLLSPAASQQAEHRNYLDESQHHHFKKRNEQEITTILAAATKEFKKRFPKDEAIHKYFLAPESNVHYGKVIKKRLIRASAFDTDLPKHKNAHNEAEEYMLYLKTALLLTNKLKKYHETRSAIEKIQSNDPNELAALQKAFKEVHQNNYQTHSEYVKNLLSQINSSYEQTIKAKYSVKKTLAEMQITCDRLDALIDHKLNPNSIIAVNALVYHGQELQKMENRVVRKNLLATMMGVISVGLIAISNLAIVAAIATVYIPIIAGPLLAVGMLGYGIAAALGIGSHIIPDAKKEASLHNMNNTFSLLSRMPICTNLRKELQSVASASTNSYEQKSNELIALAKEEFKKRISSVSDLTKNDEKIKPLLDTLSDRIKKGVNPIGYILHLRSASILLRKLDRYKNNPPDLTKVKDSALRAAIETDTIHFHHKTHAEMVQKTVSLLSSGSRKDIDSTINTLNNLIAYNKNPTSLLNANAVMLDAKKNPHSAAAGVADLVKKLIGNDYFPKENPTLKREFSLFKDRSPASNNDLSEPLNPHLKKS